MAEIVLFHSALGLRPGVTAAAARPRKRSMCPTTTTRLGLSAAAAVAGSPRDRTSQILRRIAGAGRQTPAHPGREKCRLLGITRTVWPLLITTTTSPCAHISPQFPKRRYY